MTEQLMLVRVTDGFPQPSQQKQEIEIIKDLGSTILSTDMNACDIHRRPTKFLRTLYQQKHCLLGLKETEIGQNEGKLSDSPNSTSRKQADKTIQLQTHTSFQVKEGSW